MNTLSCFDFDGIAIRVVPQDGEPWFVVADVCNVLAISNSRDAITALDADEKSTVANPDSRPGKPGAKSFQIVSESGLYTLVFKSRKPEAKRFRKWVTAVVLPAIRKTGRYEVASAPIDADHQELLDRLDMVEYRLGATLELASKGRVSASYVRMVSALATTQIEALRLTMEVMSANALPENLKIGESAKKRLRIK